MCVDCNGVQDKPMQVKPQGNTGTLCYAYYGQGFASLHAYLHVRINNTSITMTNHPNQRTVVIGAWTQQTYLHLCIDCGRVLKEQFNHLWVALLRCNKQRCCAVLYEETNRHAIATLYMLHKLSIDKHATYYWKDTLYVQHLIGRDLHVNMEYGDQSLRIH